MNGINADVVGGVLHGGGLGEQAAGALAGVVGGGSGAAHNAVDRGYVDDRTAARLEHFRHGVFDAQKSPFGVDIHLAVPDRLAGFRHSVAGGGASVVDQHIERAVSGYGGGHGVNPILLAGNIQLDEHSVAAGGADLGGGAFPVGGVNVAEDDFGALSAEHPGRRAAETHQRAIHAAGRPADEGHFALQSHTRTPWGARFRLAPE